MSCCNQRRGALRSGTVLRAASRPAPAPVPQDDAVALRWLGARAQTLRGPSGATYLAQPGAAPLLVAPADAQALLRTGLLAAVASA